MPQIYGSPHAGSIADLMRQQGEVRARQAEAQGQAEAARAAASGQIWGQAIQNIGQGVSGTLADFAKQRQGPTPDDVYKIAQVQKIRAELAKGKEEDKRAKIGEMASMIAASGYKPEAAEPLFRVIASESPEYEQPLMRSLMDPAALKQVTDQLRTLSPGYKAPGTRQIETAGPNGPQIQIVEDVPGQTFAKPKEPEKPVVVQGALVKPSSGEVVYQAPEKPEREQNVTETQLALMAAQGNAQAAQALQKLRAMRAPQTPPTVRSPIWVVGPDGEFQDLAGVAPPGSKPANTREQGRPVVSGDANRIADFDTSLNDISTLRTTLTATKDSTGTIAKVGTMLPNWATELTGWGEDAKKRNAVIARVKQVIGKALEGGVLRKEDEEKYKDILPTIYDTAGVAASKLNGLERALQQRRQTTLDALADAGYDVSRYQERGPSTGGMVTLIAPDGTEKSVPANEVDHYLSLGAKRKP